MNKITACVAAVAAMAAAPTFAADMAVKMPVKAPPPAPAPIYSWTGWYVGANVGGGWGDRHVSFTANDPIVAGVIVPPPQSFSTSGVVGGLQLGYNWQLQPNWLLGFETDFDWSTDLITTMSAFGGKADILQISRHVCPWLLPSCFRDQP